MSKVRARIRVAIAGGAGVLLATAAIAGGVGHASSGKDDATEPGGRVGALPSMVVGDEGSRLDATTVHDHSTDHHDAAPRHRRDRAKGLVFRGLRAEETGPCRGIFSIDGKGLCSHGPDAPPAGYDVKEDVPPVESVASESTSAATTAAGTVQCYGNGTDGNRVQVLYIYSGTSRYQQYLSSFQAWAKGMDDIYSRSAGKTGGVRHIRFQTDADCVPTVTPVQVSSGAISSFSTMINELRSRGYNRTDRKYTVYGDANVYCGIGEFTGDTRKSADNRSNFGPHFARTDAGCWGADVIAHELGHNLGAVNNNAPNTSKGAHCTDEYDVMCYSDSPYYPPMRYVCASTQASLLDCNNDDYYHTNPPAGSYLAQYWNMADSVFLERRGGGTTPDPEPDPDPTPDPTTCSGYQNDASGQLAAGGDARVPNGSYFWSSRRGTHTACLTGPSTADFDLYFQRWNGSYWVTVAKSTSSTSQEKITYSGNVGYYRYWIDAYSGSGAWTMGWNVP